ncbi:MAG: hypothetical protein ABR600_07115 [Actinomycetota bacterium]
MPCDGAWHQQDAGQDPNEAVVTLTDVSAISASDAWGVGSTYDGIDFHTLIEHWDGQGWSVVPSPDPGERSELLGVAAIDATHAWAVGDVYGGPGTAIQTLVEQWDGQQWLVVPSPNHAGPGRAMTQNILSDVVALGPDEAWAVGTYYGLGGSAFQTLAVHFSHGAWRLISTPNPGPAASEDELLGVDASSANNVIAVGHRSVGTSDVRATLVERWNGTSWRMQKSPDAGAPTAANGHSNELFGVSLVSRRDAWAVGRHARRTAGDAVLALHWDGTAWKRVRAATPQGATARLTGVDMIDGGDGLAVGYTVPANDNAHTLVERWHDGSWSVEASPTPSRGGSLAAVSTPSAASSWAVGSAPALTTGGSVALIELSCS